MVQLIVTMTVACADLRGSVTCCNYSSRCNIRPDKTVTSVKSALKNPSIFPGTGSTQNALNLYPSQNYSPQAKLALQKNLTLVWRCFRVFKLSPPPLQSAVTVTTPPPVRYNCHHHPSSPICVTTTPPVRYKCHHTTPVRYLPYLRRPPPPAPTCPGRWRPA